MSATNTIFVEGALEAQVQTILYCNWRAWTLNAEFGLDSPCGFKIKPPETLLMADSIMIFRVLMEWFLTIGILCLCIYRLSRLPRTLPSCRAMKMKIQLTSRIYRQSWRLTRKTRSSTKSQLTAQSYSQPPSSVCIGLLFVSKWITVIVIDWFYWYLGSYSWSRRIFELGHRYSPTQRRCCQDFHQGSRWWGRR